MLGKGCFTFFVTGLVSVDLSAAGVDLLLRNGFFYLVTELTGVDLARRTTVFLSIVFAFFLVISVLLCGSLAEVFLVFIPVAISGTFAGLTLLTEFLRSILLSS